MSFTVVVIVLSLEIDHAFLITEDFCKLLISHVQLFVAPWTAAHQASLPSLSPEFAQNYVHCVDDAIQPSHPLFLLPSIFPSIRVFSNVPALHIRWPKYWSFGFSINPSNGYSGLISFRTDWFDFLAVQGTQ